MVYTKNMYSVAHTIEIVYFLKLNENIAEILISSGFRN